LRPLAVGGHPARTRVPPSSRAVEWSCDPARKGSAMAKNIYVGNLVWDATADDLLALFQGHGSVARAQVITDRETGRSRGFGFVEMENDAEAQAAIDALNGTNFRGRPLTVNEAKPRENRGGAAGGGGARGGRGGGRGGRGGGGGGGGGGGVSGGGSEKRTRGPARLAGPAPFPAGASQGPPAAVRSAAGAGSASPCTSSARTAAAP